MSIKDLIIIIMIALFSLFIISINGVNFSALFIVASVWIVYSSYILSKVSKIKNTKTLLNIAKIYKVLVVIFISSIILIEGLLLININNFKEADEIEKLDYMIVLGAGLDGYNVGKTLKSRLDKAIEYYALNQDVKIIVTGGQGKDEVISEAEAMYKYLISKDIPKDSIIKEDKATTTLENMIFSKEILEQRGDEDKKVLIVTNEFHLTRSMLIAKILG
ncbi:MAG: YdcF family protein, partial [Paraclostridium sp.]